MNFKLLSLFFVIVGCSTTQKKTIDPIEDKYANVKFEKVKEQTIGDNFSYSDKATDNRKLLEDMSATRVFRSLNESQFSSDVISQISYACYKNNVKKFEKLVRLNSKSYEKHPGFWNQVGVCYLLFKEERKSLLFFNKASNIDKKFLPSRVNIFYYYMLRGEVQRSISILEKLLKSNPNNSLIKFNLGTLLLDNHILLSAKNVFDSLNNEDSSDPDVNGALGTINYFLGKHQEADQYFSKLDSQSLTNPLWGINFVRNLLQLKREEEAKAYFYKIKQNDTKYDEYFNVTKPLVDNS